MADISTSNVKTYTYDFTDWRTSTGSGALYYGVHTLNVWIYSGMAFSIDIPLSVMSDTMCNKVNPHPDGGYIGTKLTSEYESKMSYITQTTSNSGMCARFEGTVNGEGDYTAQEISGTPSYGSYASFTVNGTSVAGMQYFNVYLHVIGKRTISLSVSPTGAGTVSGGGEYYNGTTVGINAFANDGYNFVQWSDGDTNASRSVTADDNKSYTAQFAEKSRYTVAIDSNNPLWGGVDMYNYQTGDNLGQSASVLKDTKVMWRAWTGGDEFPRCSFLYWDADKKPSSATNKNYQYYGPVTISANTTHTAYFAYNDVLDVKVSQSMNAGKTFIVADRGTEYETSYTVQGTDEVTIQARNTVRLTFEEYTGYYVRVVYKYVEWSSRESLMGDVIDTDVNQDGLHLSVNYATTEELSIVNYENVFQGTKSESLGLTPTMYDKCCTDKDKPSSTPRPFTYSDTTSQVASWFFPYDGVSAFGKSSPTFFYTAGYPIHLVSTTDGTMTYSTDDRDKKQKWNIAYVFKGLTAYPPGGYSTTFRGLTIRHDTEGVDVYEVTGKYEFDNPSNTREVIYLVVTRDGGSEQTLAMQFFHPGHRTGENAITTNVHLRSPAQYDCSYTACYDDRIYISVNTNRGLTFAGFYDGPHSTTYLSKSATSKEYIYIKNADIYAGWNGTNLVLNKRGGTGGSDDVSNLQYAQALPDISVPTPPSSELDFKGYYTEVDGGGSKVYDATGKADPYYANDYWYVPTVQLYAYYGVKMKTTDITTPDGSICTVYVTDSKGKRALDAGTTTTLVYQEEEEPSNEIMFETVMNAGYVFSRYEVTETQLVKVTDNPMTVNPHVNRTIEVVTGYKTYNITYTEDHINGNRKEFTIADLNITLYDPSFPAHEFVGWYDIDTGKYLEGTTEQIKEARNYNLRAYWYSALEVSDVYIYKNSANITNKQINVGADASTLINAIPYPETAESPIYKWETYYSQDGVTYTAYNGTEQDCDFPLQLRTTASTSKVYPYVLSSKITDTETTIPDPSDPTKTITIPPTRNLFYKVVASAGQGEAKVIIKISDEKTYGVYQREFKDRCIIQVIGEDSTGAVKILRQIDLGTITSLSESIRIDKVSTPTPSYSANATFVHDKGVTEQISLNFSRKSHTWYKSTDMEDPMLDDDGMPIDNCKNFVYDEQGNLIPDKEKFDDEKYDSVFWSNKFFAKVMRKIVNRWQVDTDGIKFLYIPRKCNGTNGMNYRVIGGGAWSETDEEYHFIGVNAYIKSYSTEYTTDTTDVLKGDMTVYIGGMNANYT